MSNISYRKATLDDLAVLQELNSQLFLEDGQRAMDYDLNYDWSKSDAGAEFYRHMITSENCFATVALDGQEVVGYLCGEARSENSVRPIKYAELEDMFVKPSHRSQGIGGELVDQFLIWANSQQVKKIRVTTYVANESGIKFYQRKGFAAYSITLERSVNIKMK